MALPRHVPPALAWVLLLGAGALAGTAGAQHPGHHHGMSMDASGMVMGENADQLPAGCAAISGETLIEVEAGSEFARARPGQVFGYNQHQFEVAPCARVTVRLSNRDEVRHHWMLHGLPRYLHPGGMFHLEAAGGATVEGRFIAPAEDATYLVHCDVAQHMEKGMKAQLVVGAGGAALWAVPGVTAPFNRADYLAREWLAWMLGGLLSGLALAWLILRE